MEERLHLQVAGEWYEVNEKGEFLVGSRNYFSPNWLFLGVCTHHWHHRIIHKFAEIWNNPELAKKGYVWDLDHGTIRLWAGRRISYVYKREHKEKSW